jgi:quinol monooxygenase YgiN
MSEVHVFATVTAGPGHADALRDVLKDLVTASHEEPGVLQYILHEDPKNLGNFYVFEAYKDQDAANAHMASPHLATAFAKAGALVGGAPSIIETKVVAGH